jgi:hypothetical protein
MENDLLRTLYRTPGRLAGAAAPVNSPEESFVQDFVAASSLPKGFDICDSQPEVAGRERLSGDFRSEIENFKCRWQGLRRRH